MADNYLTTTIVDHFLGSVVRTELCSDDATYATSTFLGIAVAATSVVQAALRNSGYTVPATNTDEYVKLATVGVFMQLAYSRPEKELPFAEGWETHIANVAATDILSGDAMLNLPVSGEQGIGGAKVSENSTSVTSLDGGHMQVFSRKQMVGY